MKSTITRERLQEITEDGFLKHGESKVLARMALAAMDSEPVAEIRAYYPLGIDGGKQKFVQVTGELPDFGAQLYAIQQPAPVVLDEIECDICGHVSTDPEGRHHCCEDYSND